MESFLIKALQLILSLSIIVVIHEFGHFFFARMFKIRVEKFYLFFNPWFSLFKYKPKNSDTEYGLGWLPLGGYVKISGMIDESMDKEQMAKPAEPWEFRAKPAWQRLLVMIGGVLFNFILAAIIYSMVLFTWGNKYLPMENMKYGLEFSEPVKKMGFHDGDILLSADGVKIEKLGESVFQIAEAKEVKVLRDGSEVAIAVPDSFMATLLSEKKGFADPIIPAVLADITKDSPAEKAGIKKNDSIVAIDDVAIAHFSNIAKALENKQNKDITVSYFRNGEEHQTKATIGENGLLGVIPVDPFEYKTIEYGFLESIPAGVVMGVDRLSGYVSQFKYVFTKEGATSIGGFGTLGSLFPETWNWQNFWLLTGFLTVALGFMNILPIPALDGGHVLFLLYEVVARRKPNEKFMEYAQVAGMIFLFALLLFANGNDIFRTFFN